MGRFLQGCCLASIGFLVLLTVQGLAAALFPSDPARPLAGAASHVVWGFLVTVFVLFAHTITMFYFIGTGSAVKEAAKTRPSLVPLYERTRRFKARTSGSLTLAPLLLMAASIAGAGVAGGSVGAKVHLALAAVAGLFNVWTLYKVTGVIGENIALMDEAERILASAADAGSGPSPASAR